MSEINNKAVSQCLKIAEELDLASVKSIVDEYVPLINNDDVNTTFIDLSGIPDGLIELAAYICGTDVLSKFEKQLRRCGDWEARLEYGDEQAIYVGDKIPECKILDDTDTAELISPIRLMLTAPSKALYNNTVYLICAGSSDNANTHFIAASSRLILLTNATMALTNVQKNWMDSFVKEKFDFDRFSIYITHMDKLLEEKQEEEVVNYIKDYLNKYGQIGSNVLDKKTVIEYISRDGRVQKDKAKRCTVCNLIREIGKQLEAEIKCFGMKTEEYSRVSCEIAKMSTSFIHAGEISANNVLDNYISEIVNSISKSAEEYSKEMFESIKKTILSAKDIDDVEEKIAPYMEQSWKFFAKETSRQISKDFDTINLMLTKRMEIDVEDMVGRLDIDAQTVIEAFVNNSDSMNIPSPGYEHVSDEARKAVGRNARTLIILSIPMLFISPTLSIATLLGSGIYSKLGRKQEDRKYRDELVVHVEHACIKARKNAVGSFETTLCEEKERMKSLVLQGYQNFLDLILESIEQRKKNAEMSAGKALELAAVKADLEDKIRIL